MKKPVKRRRRKRKFKLVVKVKFDGYSFNRRSVTLC